jgi:hypothetical protein
MSDGDEGDSEAAAEEQDEPSGQAVTVVDPERQVLETEIDQTILIFEITKFRYLILDT